MSTPTKLTQLEVINDMLSLIRRSPINSLNPPYTADVAFALQIFNKHLRMFQVTGWYFNTEKCVEMIKNSEDNYVIPADVVRIDTVYHYPEYVEKAGKLYDKTNNTFTITTSPLKVDRVIYMDFDDMPEEAKFLVQALCGYEFQGKIESSAKMFTKEDVEMAWTRFIQYDMESSDDNTGKYDTVWNILNRTRIE